MSDRINLDDPNYNQGQVTIQNDKAKVLWTVLGALAGILIVAVIVLQSGSSGKKIGNSASKVKHGMYFDYYDDNGDGWVDRMYSYDTGSWRSIPTGNLSMNEAS